MSQKSDAMEVRNFFPWLTLYYHHWNRQQSYIKIGWIQGKSIAMGPTAITHMPLITKCSASLGIKAAFKYSKWSLLPWSEQTEKRKQACPDKILVLLISLKLYTTFKGMNPSSNLQFSWSSVDNMSWGGALHPWNSNNYMWIKKLTFKLFPYSYCCQNGTWRIYKAAYPLATVQCMCIGTKLLQQTQFNLN